MNVALLCGNVTRDPDVRETQSGMKIARYTIAINRRGKNDDADFIQCTVFDRGAEFAEKYVRKGTRLIVRGHIQTGSYTDRDGKKIYTTDVIVDDQEFACPKQSAETDDEKDDRRRREFDKSNKAEDKSDGFMPIPDDLEDDGLPFA